MNLTPLTYEQVGEMHDLKNVISPEQDFFEVISGEIVISDPCYEKGTWCQTIEKAKNGKWMAAVDIDDKGTWGTRVANLVACHEDYNRLTDNSVRCVDNLGVDSGQMGVFDSKMYRDNTSIPEGHEPNARWKCEKFYGACCELTLSDEQSGLIPFGCVSSSGYGDGCYEGKLYFNAQSEVVRVEVNFIQSEYNDEDDYEDDYEEYEE